MAYLRAGVVVSLRAGQTGIRARVLGTRPYAVRFWQEGRRLGWGCTCPLGIEGEFCKHLVAAGLAWIAGGSAQPGSTLPGELRPLREFLESADREELVTLLIERAVWDEDLLDELALEVRAAKTGRR